MGIQGTGNCRGAARALIIAALAASAALCGPARAADTNVIVNATVVRPNTLIKTDDLDFGTLISGPTAGTVTINPVTNARTTGGGATAIANDGQRAIFQGTGGILLITVSGSTSATLARVGGAAPAMTASLVRAASTGGGGVALLGGTLLPSGVQTYYIGGTLTVPANQPAGDYSGTFTLTVNYL
ncbi:DUF4402 domain-containing protein [Sphingopyxis sp. CCNWLW253]|uniref:DUF4402 domain-containing protein n=1 Tax=unclassified Sphingopyxis TaxID=2614943 RepID=UPI003012CD50